MSSAAEKHYYLALDIETGGPRQPEHQLVSIGVAVVDQDETVVEKHRFPVPFDIEKFDRATLAEFWQNEEKNPGITEYLKQFHAEGAAMPSMKAAIQAFVDAYDRITSQYKNIQLVSDYPEFDIGILNQCVGEHTDRLPLGFYGGKKYPRIARAIGTFYHTHAGAEHRYSQFANKNDALKRLGVEKASETCHDHAPENDAADMAVNYVRAMNAWYRRESETEQALKKARTTDDVLTASSFCSFQALESESDSSASEM